MITFHIRKPSQTRSRAFQRSTTAATFCGAKPTEHDIRASWQADSEPIGDYVCCERCIAARKLKPTVS